MEPASNVCPVACIHTKPGAPQFYIDPEVCIDCEQCEIVCPVDAIFKDIDLPAEHQASIEVNAAFFRKNKAAVGPVPVETAWHMIHSAQEYAETVGIAVTVAVVDEAGYPIAVGKMDGAEPDLQSLLSIRPIRRRPFTFLPPNWQPKRGNLGCAASRSPTEVALCPAGGGLPIIDGVVIVGGVGVAGASRPEQDILCCRAAITVLESPRPLRETIFS